ncbi:hypothetical protein ID850_09495 [Xenorhabdus sp. Flor]|nr:hypothetical protein [Xenorhabdus sp. Flor]MBD2814993.1 hypothetical protein [Xenorhabdus sp. Flor]
MGNAVKIGDIGTEHGDCSATPVITGARTGDAVDCGGVVIGGGSVNIG